MKFRLCKCNFLKRKLGERKEKPHLMPHCSAASPTNCVSVGDRRSDVTGIMHGGDFVSFGSYNHLELLLTSIIIKPLSRLLSKPTSIHVLS